MILIACLFGLAVLVPTIAFLFGEAACRRESDKACRDMLYEKQRKLFNLGEGQETCCLPGELAKVNPFLVR